jgi:two-component system heavy metal sensor histidine kinase CusS
MSRKGFSFTLHSMAARLSAGFAVVYLIVFVSVGCLLYKSLADELKRSDAETLQGKLQVVEHLIEEARTTGDLIALKHHLDDALIGHGDLRVWLLDPSGKLTYGGDQMPIMIDPKGDGHVSVRREDGLMLEGARKVIANATSLSVHEIVVGIDTRPRERLLASYRRSIFWLGGAGLIAAVLLGAYATSRGLRPIKRLSNEAMLINAQSSDQRLSTRVKNSELDGLVVAFNGALDRLSAAYRHMEAFNADVAHELRTPLATLIAGTEVALSRERTSNELRDTLGEGLEELQSMKTLVNDMLFVARADRGELALELQSTSALKEVEHAVQYFEASLEEARLTVQVTGDAQVRCNANLVRRAVANLLSNAIKYAAVESIIGIAIETSSDQVWITVLNRGDVVPPDVLDQMFTRFFRADKARALRGESHGLGLSIVKAIAQMHGGAVAATSDSDHTVVGFSLRLRHVVDIV